MAPGINKSQGNQKRIKTAKEVSSSMAHKRNSNQRNNRAVKFYDSLAILEWPLSSRRVCCVECRKKSALKTLSEYLSDISDHDNSKKSCNLCGSVSSWQTGSYGFHPIDEEISGLHDDDTINFDSHPYPLHIEKKEIIHHGAYGFHDDSIFSDNEIANKVDDDDDDDCIFKMDL